EQWTQIIRDCLASGQSKKTWCEENGISEKAFYYWQRILRNEACLESKQLPTTAPPLQKEEMPVAFVELKPMSSLSPCRGVFQPDIVIRSEHFVFEIANTASESLLRHLGGLLHVK
ncbi:MAG: IS66 family insertion sequence element accessory protein TnpB, partial [Lachnospiraceae bacterium]|nr:IS66 family insertion sequence element accessory protein TnpB [Lachnospiraceae bacterium]